jgi:hypothetical protein
MTATSRLFHAGLRRTSRCAAGRRRGCRGNALWRGAGAVRYAVVASRGVWRSLVARFVRDEEVVGSNPATPTREIRWYVSYPSALALVGGISVDHRGRQFGQRVNQVVFGVVGDEMRGSQAQRGVDVEFGVGV